MTDGPMIQINYDTLVVTQECRTSIAGRTQKAGAGRRPQTTRGFITFLAGKLPKLLKIEKGNCCYHFELGGSLTLDQEAYSHIFT